MKKKISKFISIFLIAIMLISQSSLVFADVKGDDEIDITFQQNAIEDITNEEPIDVDFPIISDEPKAEKNDDASGNSVQESTSGESFLEEENSIQESEEEETIEEPDPNLSSEEYSLSEEDLNSIQKFKSIREKHHYLNDSSLFDTGSEPIPLDSKLSIVKINADSDVTQLAHRALTEDGYIELVLESIERSAINDITIYAKENVDLVRDIFPEDQEQAINDILDQIDAHTASSESEAPSFDLDTYREIKGLLEELNLISAHYSLDDQGLTIEAEERDEAEDVKHVHLKNNNLENEKIKIIVKINEEAFLGEKELVKLVVGHDTEEDEYSLVYQGEQLEMMSFAPLQLGSTRAIQTPQEIPVDDIAPQNYLNLLANMPGASAEIVEYSGVNGGWIKDIKTLPADAPTEGGALWNGDWSIASKKAFTQFAGDGATAVRFTPSDKWARNYKTDMNAGWNLDDLNLDTTNMWVKVKYTNAAYYKNEIVDAEAVIKITPMKNRHNKSYNYRDYGNDPYYPIIQFSHNLYKGWSWQNVREINVDLVFKRKNGETIQFESSNFDDEKGTYFTINSLNEATKHTGGSVHSLGPEYVRPAESTITGAYVIPGSHIQTAYNGGRISGIQTAYNGGTDDWYGDDPNHPNWSQNSVLFTTANTSHLNFTMGNLMRDPDWGYVPRTNFVWTSMSTQSFANHYVTYKDTQVNKSWSDGGGYHGPIVVNLYKNYKVTISYPQGSSGAEERSIDVQNLLTDTVLLSNATNWTSGFYRIPDEASQEKLINKIYKNNKNQLQADAGANFPEDIPTDFQIVEVADFNYTVSEVSVPGYTSSIEISTNNNKDIYDITNTKDPNPPEDPSTPGDPSSLKPNIFVKKQIDYLGDGDANTDTGIQGDSQYKNQLNDIYRLYLTIEGEKVSKEDPLDLLFVLDASSTMNIVDMIGANGQSVSRIDAMLHLVNNTDIVTNFLNKNPGNRVAFLYFNGSSKQGTVTQANMGYTYKNDAHILRGWSNQFNKDIRCEIPQDNYAATNYMAGLMLAEDLLNVSEAAGRKQAMIFISDGVPTLWIDEDGNRVGTGSNLDTTYTVPEAKNNTMAYLNGFYERHPNVTTYAVGVSADINAEDTNASQSPEVLKRMAQLGKGEHIGVESDTDELINRLRQVIEATVSEVRVEDTLSARVELIADQADYKVVKKNYATEQEVVLWENGGPTTANGQGNEQILESLTYNSIDKKIVLTFNPSYELEDDVEYVLSYNVKTTKKAKDDYLVNDGYDQTGDDGTDYEENATSAGKEGFRSNHEAKVYYNADQTKEFPHPVVQVNTIPGFELPGTGGRGTLGIRAKGMTVLLITVFAIMRKKKFA